MSELNISLREFKHWQAFLAMEPPDEADNYRTAMILSQITNMAGKSLAKGKNVSPEDFLSMKKPAPIQTAEQQKQFLKGLSNGS